MTTCGRICFNRRKINLSVVLASQSVGIEQVSDEIRLVSFMDYDLGYFDSDIGRKNYGLVLLRHKLIVALDLRRRRAARTSLQSFGERDVQSSPHCCDRVWDVPFGSDRGSRGVDNLREGQVS